jgi:hypothetical protein
MLEMGSIAIASRADATSEEIAEAMVIHAHVEKLLLVVFATRARSCEIVQAILVSTASRSDMLVDFSDPKSHRHTLAQRDGRQPRAQD